MTALRMLREMGTTYWGRGRSRNRAPEVTLRNARRDTMAAQDNVHIAQDGFAAMSWTSRRTPVRSPASSRSITPPSGSGVSRVMPASSSARVFATRVPASDRDEDRIERCDGIELVPRRPAAFAHGVGIVVAPADPFARRDARGALFDLRKE